MRAIHVLASAITCLPIVAAAQNVTITNLLESLTRLNQDTSVELRCSTRLEQVNTANAANLFYAAGTCFREKRSFDGSFLLLAGQIRSTTDFQMFEPRSESDKEVMGTLWGILFYQLGGTGDEALYLDAVKRKALFDRLLQWQPTISESYDPGWVYKGSPTSARYSAAVESGKQHRKRQLENYAQLISDSRYYAAQKELEEIQRRNPRGIDVKSEDGKRAAELTRQMSDVVKELKVDFTR